jgi:hypothetical protein
LRERKETESVVLSHGQRWGRKKENHTVDDQPIPPLQRRPFQGAVLALKEDERLHELDPAAGLEVVVDAPEQLRKVGEEGAHVAAMDVVELVAVDPLVLGVVDLEAAVGRHVLGLDGRQVGAEHVRLGVLVRELHRPNPRPRTHVQHPAGLVDRREVELPVQNLQGYPVLQIESTNLLLKGEGNASKRISE